MKNKTFESLVLRTWRTRLEQIIEQVAQKGSLRALWILQAYASSSCHDMQDVLAEAGDESARLWLERFADEHTTDPPYGYMYENTGNYLPGGTWSCRIGKHKWSEDCWFLDA